MTPLQQHWKYLAHKHHLDVDIPFAVKLAERNEINIEVRLKGYGGQNGMLLVSDFDVIEPFTDKLVEMGFGFSCLSQPSAEDIKSDEGLYEMLDDWGKV